MNKNADMLLSILQYYAPTGSAQQVCTEMYLRAQQEGIRDDDLVKVMTGALYDGLQYGNWPWTVGMVPK